MSKKSLGFIVGIFLGLLGLFGLAECENEQERNEFMSGWAIAFIIQIILALIIFAIASTILANYKIVRI